MSKPKGIIVIELPEVPEDCYRCNQRNGDGYCKYVGKFVDHLVKPGERHPLCPIREMPQPRSECSWEEYDAGWDDCLVAFLGELPEAEEKPQGPSKPLSPMDKFLVEQLLRGMQYEKTSRRKDARKGPEMDWYAGPKTKEAIIRIIGMKKMEDGDE